MKVNKDGKIEIEAADMPAANNFMIHQAVQAIQLMPNMRAQVEAQAKAGNKLSIEVLKRADAAPPVSAAVAAMQKIVEGFK